MANSPVVNRIRYLTVAVLTAATLGAGLIMAQLSADYFQPDQPAAGPVPTTGVIADAGDVSAFRAYPDRTVP